VIHRPGHQAHRTAEGRSCQRSKRTYYAKLPLPRWVDGADTGDKDLAAEINTRVVSQVALNESKPGGVKTNREKLRAATGAFLADLLIARSRWNRFAMRLGYNDGEVSGWVAWSAVAG
jgi:hypothetical protein